MATTARKAERHPKNGAVTEASTKDEHASQDVLTLSEAATYLRVPEEDILRLTRLQELPGRQIGNEWRFLKAGLQDWLRTPERKPTNEAFLALAGTWKDDPDIEAIVQEAHRLRGRPSPESRS